MKKNTLSGFKDSQHLAYEAMEYIKEMIVGKSSVLDDDPSIRFFLLHTVSPMINQEKSVVLFSLKIPARELIVRLLSIQTSIPLKKLCIADVTDKQWKKLGEAIDKMNCAKIFINEEVDISQFIRKVGN